MAYSDFEKTEAFKDTLEVTFQENEEPYCDDKIEVENLVSMTISTTSQHARPLSLPLPRTFRVRVNNSYSNTGSCLSGVPQGSVLSPYLYNIYTHDFPQHSTVSTCLFADDSAVLSEGVQLKRLRSSNFSLEVILGDPKTRSVIERPTLFPWELDAYEFQRRFRLTKESVAELTLLIEDKLESKTPFSNYVSQPTVCRVVHRVSEAIAPLLPDFIHLPVNREECKTV
ncbi:nuclease HARBI1 [Trichonephila clavipes]|nr:nuclease HARBI1 [Trichonephila clavipes]